MIQDTSITLVQHLLHRLRQTIVNHAPPQTTIHLAFHQPEARQLRTHYFCLTAEKGLRQCWKILGDERGSYGKAIAELSQVC